MCKQILLRPTGLTDDGKMRDAARFDIETVEILNPETIELPSTTSGRPRHGADIPAPRK